MQKLNKQGFTDKQGFTGANLRWNLKILSFTDVIRGEKKKIKHEPVI